MIISHLLNIQIYFFEIFKNGRFFDDFFETPGTVNSLKNQRTAQHYYKPQIPCVAHLKGF